MGQFNNQGRRQESPAERYAEWIALGAIAAGSIGAVVGMATCRRERTTSLATDEPIDPTTVTAPHGDTLRGVIV